MIMEDDRVIFRELCDFISFQHDHKLTEEFINGLAPQILNYDKFQIGKNTIPAIQRYLIGYESYIKYNEKPPLQYYDIARACRHTLSMQLLHSKISDITKIKNYQDRINKLNLALTFDEFESILFELLVGAKYSALRGVKHIEFIPESQSKQPDILVVTDRDIHVECKRMNRLSDESVEIRNCVRTLNNCFAKSPGGMNHSALLSVNFHIDPRKINLSDWIMGCQTALANKFVETSHFTLIVEPLKSRYFKEMRLFPSPQFYELEYDYREGEPWHGITQAAELHFDYLSELHSDMKAASTLLGAIKSEVVLKWKLSDEETIKAYTKLNFGLVFKGLKQLEDYKNTILHFAYERDKAAGHRQDSLMNLFNRMKKYNKDKFSWIIFNELQFSVSHLGRNDLVEHAHPISGPGRFSKEPLVTNIFTEGDYFNDGLAEFGVGHEVEDIDLIFESDTKNENRRPGPALLRRK